MALFQSILNTPEQIVEQLSWRLRAAKVPQFSGAILETYHCSLFWLLDRPFTNSDYHEAAVISQGIEHALDDIARKYSGARICDSLRLPLAYGDREDQCRLFCRSAVVPMSRDHLYMSCLNHVTASSVDSIRRAADFTCELGELFFERWLEVSQRPELHWAWLTTFGGALTPFTDPVQLRQCLIAIAESLLNMKWADIADQMLHGWNISYAGFVDVVQRHARDRQIRLLDGSYSIDSAGWLPLAASALQVQQREINELRLQRLLPLRAQRCATRYIRTPTRNPVGIEDFVPVGRILLKAA